MRKAQLAAVLTLALAVPVGAAEKQAAEKGGRPGTNVDMPFLMAPLTNADGRLLGYAYLSSRLTAESESYALAVRDKLPFIQDAMVRDVNSTPVAAAADPEQVDVPAVEKRLLTDAARVLGPGKVKLITICTVQIAELHPVQTPALNGPTDPKPLDEHKNPAKSRCET